MRSLLATIPADGWRRLSCGNGSKGPRLYDWVLIPINAPDPELYCRWLLIRRNIIIILLSVELMLNATNINFVAFSQSLHNIAGQVFVFFALTVAAAEVAVGLAIIIALHRAKNTINVDEFQLLKW